MSAPRYRRTLWISAGLVFLGALVLYIWTLAPTVTLVDSGELIVAARGLGVAHPPGFPLYVLLAHVATLVPIGNIAQRVNFASALFAALASAALTLVVAEAICKVAVVGVPTRKVEGRSTRDKKRARRSSSVVVPVADADRQPPSLFVYLAPAAAGLLFACSRTLWAYATIAEVYTLNTLLIVTIVLLMLRWRRSCLTAGAGHQPSPAAAAADRWLYGAAFLFGLALGVHHVTVGLMLPGLGVLVFWTAGSRFFTSRRLLYAAVFALAGLAIYLYLPLAASRSPIMNWGDPRSLERLWWHVTGRQYQVFLTSSSEIMGKQLGDFAALTAREFGPWWLPVGLACAAAGFLALLRRDRALFGFLLLIMLADVAYGMSYEIAEDKDAYYLPSFVAMAAAAGVGLTWLVGSAVKVLPASLSKAAAVALVLLVPMTALAGNLPYNDRSRYFIARDYVDNLLSAIAPGGMLLTLDWQVYSPLLYVREIEYRRQDVVVIDVHQLRRSWYFEYLGRTYPELLDRTRDKVGPFLEDLKHWEQDPELYRRDPTLTRRINTRFYDMIVAFVSRHLQRAPVYMTQDIALNREAQDHELTQALTTSYQLVPQGLVFQLFADREFHEPASLKLETRGLADGSLKFDDDDVVRVKVLPVYVTMLVNRGRYLASHARHKQAIEAYEQALALSPDSRMGQQSLAESQRALRKRAGAGTGGGLD